MRPRWILAAGLISAFLISGGSAFAQTDVAASVYGAFSGTTTSTGIHQSPSNGAGGLFELRHIANPIFGFEATYSWNRANQTYRYTGPVAQGTAVCPVGATNCGQPYTVSVPSNAHEVTADWVPSIGIANLRPFGVLGVGLLLNVPSGSVSVDGTNATGDTKTSFQPVYVYGAGLDWGILPHIGLRFQYRGNLYKAPDVTTLFSSTGKFTHTAEPVIGIYLRL